MTTDERFKSLDRIQFWISNCDTKASYLLAIQGIILTILFTSQIGKMFLQTINLRLTFLHINSNSILNFFEGSIFYCMIIFFLLSFFKVYLTLIGRIDPSIFKEAGLKTNNTLFFGSIANKKYNDFVNEQNELKNDKLTKHLDSQIYINAKISQTKFTNYNKALKNFTLSIILLIVYLTIKIYSS